MYKKFTKLILPSPAPTVSFITRKNFADHMKVFILCIWQTLRAKREKIKEFFSVTGKTREKAEKWQSHTKMKYRQFESAVLLGIGNFSKVTAVFQLKKNEISGWLFLKTPSDFRDCLNFETKYAGFKLNPSTFKIFPKRRIRKLRAIQRMIE